MVTKLDLEKACNRMEWRFIKEILYNAGIPKSFIHAIMNCESGGRCKLLWNGEVTDQIRPTRRLRQGDPLSSYMFLLWLERLTHWIQSKVAIG